MGEMKTIAEIKKRYGEGAIFKLGDGALKIDRLQTGLISLDNILGGGVPLGRIVEIYGPESTGKTTLCQHIIAAAQAQGGICAFVDVEHSLDPKYAANCGVDIANLYVSQPDTGEQALEIVEALVRSEAISVLVLDSVAALLPRAELEGDMGQAHMGLQARLMSQAMRKLSGVVKQSNTIVIFTNQLRSKIGVVYGSPETTPGGNALKYYASIRIDLRRTKTLDDAVLIKVHTKKNKTAPPFQTTELRSVHGFGFSKQADLLAVALAEGLVTRGGAWYTYGSHKVQGEAAMQQLLDDPAVYGELYNICSQKLLEKRQ